MAVGDTLQGRRLPDITWGEGGWIGWTDAAPGDYVKVLEAPAVLENATTPGAGWYIVDPAGSVGSLRAHEITEHDDGTITVSPSILNTATGGWHGYLERGVWREV